MMVKFLSVEIEGFMSIGKSKIDFTDKGIVLVQGENNFEPLTKSNGSGKSAIFESILWTLTGKTSRGSSNIVNRYYKPSGAEVKLEMMIDNLHYEIIRTDGKSKSVTIIKDGEDISGNTLTKSRQILAENLGFIDYEVLTSIIILSQGLPGRLSTMRPASRKTQLEFLSNTDGFLDEINTKIDGANASISNEISNLEKEIVSLNAQISTHESTISSCELRINAINNKLKEDKGISKSRYDELQVEIREVREVISNKNKELLPILVKYNEVTTDLDTNYSSRQQASNNINRLTIDIQNMESHLNKADGHSPTCPTCTQELKSEQSVQSIKAKLDSMITSLNENNQYMETINGIILNMESIVSELTAKKESFETEINTLTNKIHEAERESALYDPSEVESTSGYESTIKTSSDAIEGLRVELDKVTEEKLVYESESEIARFYKNSASRQLRNFLLENVISYMNSRLEEYSTYLFESQGVVKLISKGNNVDIMLGDSYFEDLSGGEGRRVDLLLQLAQRDLSTSESGFRSNLLVLDEILDYLDTDGVMNTLNLLDMKSSTVECMMIVTHRQEVDVPYDSVITAVKGSDRVTEIRGY